MTRLRDLLANLDAKNIGYTVKTNSGFITVDTIDGTWDFSPNLVVLYYFPRVKKE